MEPVRSRCDGRTPNKLAKQRYDVDEKALCFVGFLLFVDPPKPEAKQTIRNLAALGVGIKVISGDNRFVTAHLAEVLGLGPPSMLAGDEISEMGDEALWHEGSLYRHLNRKRNLT